VAAAGTLRTFLAFETGDDLRARLQSLGREVAAGSPGLRLVRPEGIHLTLRFLGAATPERLEELSRRVGRSAAECPGGEAEVEGLGLFPPRGDPRVLWIGLGLPASVLELQRACEDAAVAAGFPREARPFRPHLTLGRWRDRARRPTLPPAVGGRLALRELCLFRSELLAGGARYTPLVRFPLKA
jgi:2'-5' RNA ligase